MSRKKAKRKILIRRIKAKSSYYVDELAEALGVHPNTVSNWFDKGLKRIEGAYPYLIYGQDAIDFLKERESRSHTKLKLNEFYCFKCRKGTTAKNGVANLEISAPKVGSLKAACDVCKITVTNRRISLQDLPEIEQLIKIQRMPHSTLIQGVDNSVICETKKED